MLNSKLDLFEQNWIDTVFEGRNKDYGAYQLRSKQSSTTIKAFILGSIAFFLLVSVPVISRYYSEHIAKKTETIDEVIKMVELPPPPPPDDKVKDVVLPPPPPPVEMKSLKDVKKFTALVVAPDEEVIEPIVTQKDLEKADAGSKNVIGSEDGEIVIDEKPIEVEPKVEQKVVEDAPVIYQSVEIKPEYVGGMKAFYSFISLNFRVPEIDRDFDAKVYVSFVIEKDGSLTNIKVLRDPGYGTAEEAIRVLKKMPKWKPGVQNGKNIRVSYQLPIAVKITAQ